MKTKRFWKSPFKEIFIVAIFIAILAVLSIVIYENHSKKDEATLLENYENAKETSELLKAIKDDFIEEGKGISIQEIPEDIRYEIKNNSNGNIEVYYYIEDNKSEYTARITLSNDYKVLDENYGAELKSFEEYKEEQKKLDILDAIFISLFTIILIVMIVVITIIIVFSIIKKKSQSQEERPIE